MKLVMLPELIPEISDLNLRLATLKIALGKLGTHEVGGDNHGPDVEIFQKAAGIGIGDPWCMAFVNWSAQTAAGLLHVISPLESIPLQGLVQSCYDYSKDHDWLLPASQVKSGDIFMEYFPGKKRYAHTGFVYQLNSTGNWFSTIEGNSNDVGSREGYEVCSNRRPVSSLYAFARWTNKVQSI